MILKIKNPFFLCSRALRMVSSSGIILIVILVGIDVLYPPRYLYKGTPAVFDMMSYNSISVMASAEGCFSSDALKSSRILAKRKGSAPLSAGSI